MDPNENQSPGAAQGQVFEVTMDNPEDQDELNRRLRKPGEPDCSSPTKNGPTEQGEPTTKPAGKT